MIRQFKFIIFSVFASVWGCYMFANVSSIVDCFFCSRSSLENAGFCLDAAVNQCLKLMMHGIDDGIKVLLLVVMWETLELTEKVHRWTQQLWNQMRILFFLLEWFFFSYLFELKVFFCLFFQSLGTFRISNTVIDKIFLMSGDLG